MKPLKVNISLTLDEDVLTEVRRLAEEDDRSLSSYINLLLRDRIRAWEAGKNPKEP